MNKVSNSLIIRCFIENAKLEGKKIVMRCDNTYEEVDLNKYGVSKNRLIVNDKTIHFGDVHESRDGCLLRVGEHVLEAI